MKKIYKIINVGTGIDISIDKIISEIKALKIKKLKIKYKEISIFLLFKALISGEIILSIDISIPVPTLIIL